MNQKHKHAGGGSTIASWFPADIIQKIGDAKTATGQSRSFIIAEATRFGIAEVRRRYTENGSKKDPPKATPKKAKKTK